MNQTTRKALKTGQKPRTPSYHKGERITKVKKRGKNKINEEGVNDHENKITAKVYDLNRDEELNGDFGTANHNDESGSDN